MTVTVVFDGASLPSKRGTDQERSRARGDALLKAKELESLGGSKAASGFYAKSVDVTPEMAHQVSCALRELGVNILVAPYEADAQLGYLCRNNLVDFVISEDSDLLVYGCTRVLYKVDFKTEHGREILCENIFQCPGCERLSQDTFLIACILAGCDYVDSLSSIGIKKAATIAAKAEALLRSNSNYADITSEPFLERIILLLKLSGVSEFAIDADFKDRILQAILTFRHQTVFCPITKELKNLNPTENPQPFCGELYDSEIACKVAACAIHPESKEPFFVSQDCVAEPKKTAKKSKRVLKDDNSSIKSVKSSNKPTEKTLFDYWKYTVPFSEDAKAHFSDPVIDLDQDSPIAPEETVCEVSESPTSLARIPLESFRAGSHRCENIEDSLKAIERFRYNS